LKVSIAAEVASQVGVSLPSCQRIASSAHKRYKVYFVPKRRGGTRQIAQPAREVKAVQRAIVAVLKPLVPVHVSATAYEKGSSILRNAAAHRGARFVTKLDFERFFPSITASAVAEHLRRHVQDISDRDVQFILDACLWFRDGSHALCIGAPSSPFLSNTVMYEFDRLVYDAGLTGGITFTRYSDDITISANEPDILRDFEDFIVKILAKLSYPVLVFNNKKRAAVGRGCGMYVTGLTLSNQGNVTVGRIRKRGVRAGVSRFVRGVLDAQHIEKLRGELAFVLGVEPKYRDVLLNTYGAAIIELFGTPKDR
jgi:RNA-directed DNA polymerase